jgi:protein ImuB
VPVALAVADTSGRAVRVTGRGLLSVDPALISVDGGPWQEVVGWAGPWPSTERWWSSRRRRARLQVMTAAGTAMLVVIERERWWMEAVYE